MKPPTLKDSWGEEAAMEFRQEVLRASSIGEAGRVRRGRLVHRLMVRLRGLKPEERAAVRSVAKQVMAIEARMDEMRKRLQQLLDVFGLPPRGCRNEWEEIMKEEQIGD